MIIVYTLFIPVFLHLKCCLSVEKSLNVYFKPPCSWTPGIWLARVSTKTENREAARLRPELTKSNPESPPKADSCCIFLFWRVKLVSQRWTDNGPVCCGSFFLWGQDVTTPSWETESFHNPQYTTLGCAFSLTCRLSIFSYNKLSISTLNCNPKALHISQCWFDLSLMGYWWGNNTSWWSSTVMHHVMFSQKTSPGVPSYKLVSSSCDSTCWSIQSVDLTPYWNYVSLSFSDRWDFSVGATERSLRLKRTGRTVMKAGTGWKRTTETCGQEGGVPEEPMRLGIGSRRIQ